jgi:hypothetical protein
MQEFLNWTIDNIREDKLIGDWLEERKYDWTPLVAKNITSLVDKGKSVLIITDDEREWFSQYILSNINHERNKRPLLPFYDFKCFTGQVKNLSEDDDIKLIKDMLNISFPNGYIFWYIGRSQNTKSTIAKMSKNSFLWIFDQNIPNSFILQSDSQALDTQLLQMFRLYNKTLSAVLFGKTDVYK